MIHSVLIPVPISGKFKKRCFETLPYVNHQLYLVSLVFFLLFKAFTIHRKYQPRIENGDIFQAYAHQWASDNIPSLLSPPSYRLCHHLLQAVLLWSSSHRQLNRHACDHHSVYQAGFHPLPPNFCIPFVLVWWQSYHPQHMFVWLIFGWYLASWFPSLRLFCWQSRKSIMIPTLSTTMEKTGISPLSKTRLDLAYNKPSSYNRLSSSEVVFLEFIILWSCLSVSVTI